MLRKIKVYGRLRKFIGQPVLEADVNSPIEVLTFLHCNFKGLEKHMADQYYQINAGDTKITEDLLGIRTNCDIQIIPLAHGNFFFTLALGGLFSAGGAAIGTTLLKSKLLATPERPEVSIDWRVYTKDPTKPLIRDLIIEGLSLARTQREEFNSIITNNGGDIKALFTSLKDFNSK